MSEIIIHKSEGVILNVNTFFDKIESLEDNCLHRITIENMCSPMVVEFDPEVNAMIIAMGEFMEDRREYKTGTNG